MAIEWTNGWQVINFTINDNSYHGFIKVTKKGEITIECTKDVDCRPLDKILVNSYQNLIVQKITITASGVFTDSSTENLVRGFAFDGAIQNYDLVFSDGSKISGAFLITSYERAGEFNGEETYSVTLESSNTITYTNA